MRLLLILNEHPEGAHDDVHRSLAKLRQEKLLEAYQVYPYLARMKSGLNSKDVVAEIIEKARDFQPTAILWANSELIKIDLKSTEFLKNLPSKPVFGYWDGDIYQDPYNPIPKNLASLVQNCQVSFWPGYSNSLEKLKKMGCRDLRYVPSATDGLRFGKLRTNDTQIKYDVVLVGNRISNRLPWRRWPGAKWREEIVMFLTKKLGTRFAVFGSGWNVHTSQGPIPFTEQYKAYHQSRLVIAVNNINTDLFFSNRLPIVLSSGVPLVHNYENGYFEIFQELPNPIFFRTTSEAWEKIKFLLNKDQSELDEIGTSAYQFTLKKLTKHYNLNYIINVLQDYINSKQTQSNVFIRPNPWIHKPQF